MNVTVETSTYYEKFEVPEGASVRLQMTEMEPSGVGLTIVGRTAVSEQVVGRVRLATGTVDECDSIDDMISMAVETPEYGGCGLRALRVGDQVLYDCEGDA